MSDVRLSKVVVQAYITGPLRRRRVDLIVALRQVRHARSWRSRLRGEGMGWVGEELRFGRGLELIDGG